MSSNFFLRGINQTLRFLYDCFIKVFDCVLKVAKSIDRTNKDLYEIQSEMHFVELHCCETNE